MWTLAVTAREAEREVSDRLLSKGVQTFCPYSIEKQRVKVRSTGRDTFKMIVSAVARWPRYLFAEVHTDADLLTVLATRDVRSIVRSTDGLPSCIADRHINTLRADCGPDGLILKRSTLLNYSVDDLLRFVDKSALAGATAKVLSTERLDDTGELSVLVGQLTTRVHYTEVTRA